MNYPIFASFIVFALVLMFSIHRTRDKEARHFQEFLDNEAKANSTRKKPLDDLNYITIPFDTLPVDVLSDNEDISECLRILNELSQNPIVNLTGITNTELKLKYGAPNIERLSRYDESYTLLARTLDKWAKTLYKNDFADEAKIVLEFAVATGTDVSSSYEMLASIYSDENSPDKINGLIPKAEALNSLMSKSIVEGLKKYQPTT